MNPDSKPPVQNPTSPLTYSGSGVDIDRAGGAKARIGELARSTFGPGVVSDIGSFGGVYRPDLAPFQKPLLVSSADGVGTKLKIAFMTGIHHTVGVDLVAHCSNDILTQGARPLFFLDYIAAGRIEGPVIEQIVRGLVEGCQASDCALLGGETAEMPDFYAPGEYDLVGFILGIVDEFKLLTRDLVQEGDLLIGLPSSGLHTNGFSLVRKLFFEREKLQPDSYIADLGKTVAEELLTPHRNYLPTLKELLQADDLHALAHITGGGITDNLARVLPQGLDAVIRRGTWEILPVFRFIRERGKVADAEMYRTFNMGLGMILVVAEDRLDRVQEFLRRQGVTFYAIGQISAGGGKVRYE